MPSSPFQMSELDDILSQTAVIQALLPRKQHVLSTFVFTWRDD